MSFSIAPKGGGSIQYRITWRILPIPPAPALFDQGVVDVRAIGQKQIGNGAPVLVLAECLKRDFPAEHYLRRSLLAVFLLRQRTSRRRVY